MANLEKNTKIRKKKRRTGHSVRVTLIVFLLLVLLWISGTLIYCHATKTDSAIYAAVRGLWSAMFPKEEPEPAVVPDNPYTAEDFYWENGFLHCSASEISVVGIDVSVHQGTIDWERVRAAGVQFAIIRVGYRGYGNGAVYEDENYYANVEGALAAGLQVGVYFYSQAVNTDEAREEAKFVLDRLGGYDITYPVVFDWELPAEPNRVAEVDGETLTDCAIAFCDVIETYGYRPCVYFNQSFGYQKFDLTRLMDYEFWLAEYSDVPTFAHEVQMWQYSSTGTVDGIDTIVDLNLSYRDYGEPA